MTNYRRTSRGRYNWCQGPAVEKHCCNTQSDKLPYIQPIVQWRLSPLRISCGQKVRSLRGPAGNKYFTFQAISEPSDTVQDR